MQQSVTQSDDTNARTAQLAKLISEIGPDIPEISRRLGQFKESVRYRYKEKLLDKGFAIQAAVALEKIGLKRVMFVCDFEREYRAYANAILSAMSDLCYVVYFAKTLPDGKYIVDAAVPRELAESFGRFIVDLEQKGLFSWVDVIPFDWDTNPAMQAEHYDFDRGMWDFDWSSLPPPSTKSASFSIGGPVKFDEVDLLLLKELQIDATRSLTDIASKLRINYKKLAWHHSEHVLRRELVRSYRLNWMGTTYDFKLEKALHRKHRYISLAIIVKDISDYERMDLMTKFGRLPFLWFEAAGRHYYADLAIPTDMMTEAYVYLESALDPVRDRASYYVLDSSNALTFTIAYKLYDQEKKAWAFNREELLSRFDSLLLKIKEAS